MLKIWVTGIVTASLAMVSFGAVAASGGAGDEKVITAAEQKGMTVTIYNDDLALVKDTRRFKLDLDFNKLAWRDISGQIRPETAQLRNLTHSAGFRLLEQNFNSELLAPEKLLEKYVGKEVIAIRTNPATGTETRETAIVLAANNGAVLKFGDRIETGNPGRLAFPGVPEGLRDKPTLVILLINSAQGEQNLELSYLTSGLSWRADYVAELNDREDHLDFNGWVTLINQSGIAYPNARLQLVAGDLNRGRQRLPMQRKAMSMTAEMADFTQMKQESLLDYHLYTLPRSTTLAEAQTKQVALMSANHISVTKQFLLSGADYYYFSQSVDLDQISKVGVIFEFQNSGKGLGLPLPKGVVRVYKKDSQGNAQFVGDDQIDHTAENGSVRLKLGEAFDVTADKKQTDFKRSGGEGRHNGIVEAAFQIILKNAKKESVIVVVREPVPGDWTMVSESQPHVKRTSGIAEWKISIPPNGKATLTYRVRINHLPST
jgi:Uncharacterized conserved protein